MLVVRGAGALALCLSTVAALCALVQQLCRKESKGMKTKTAPQQQQLQPTAEAATIIASCIPARPQRRKSGGRRPRGSGTKVLSFQAIQAVFGLPLCDAARHLNVCQSVLQHWCRFYHITRWPQRKVCRVTCFVSACCWCCANTHLVVLPDLVIQRRTPAPRGCAWC